MKTFSRLSLFTLVCIGLALMLGGNAVDAQIDKVTVEGLDPDTQVITVRALQVGDEQDVTITVSDKNGNLLNGVAITFAATPSTAASFAPAEAETVAGTVNTVMTVLEEGRFEVTVTADEGTIGGVGAKELIFPLIAGDSTTKIVVSSPMPVGPYKVGDTVTSTVKIQNIEDLSAWQLSVVYNPAFLALAADGVMGGDFLTDALFTSDSEEAGKITASQALIGPVDGVSGTGTLLTLEFEVLEIAEEPLGLHNVHLANSMGERLDYSIEVEGPIVVDDSFDPEDVNRDRTVNITDLMLVAQEIGKASTSRADVNDDGFVNVFDLIMVAAMIGAPEAAAGAPLARGIAHINPQAVQAWIDLARIEDDGSAMFDLGIANLQALLASSIPTETRLLINYPNPFNPETWIPYQLAEATEVTVTIHAMNGSLIRTLELGHQAAGTYKHKSEAAYWDGRNEFGEQVASGLYFYTLTAGDFSATHKMLVRK